MPRSLYFAVLLASVAGAAISQPTAMASEITTVALTGVEGIYGPYNRPGVVLTQFSNPVINNSGYVAFPAKTGTHSSSKSQLWYNYGGVIRPAVITDGTQWRQGYNFSSVGQLNYTDAGTVVFAAHPMRHNSQTDEPGIWIRPTDAGVSRVPQSKYPSGSGQSEPPRWFATNASDQTAFVGGGVQASNVGVAAVSLTVDENITSLTHAQVTDSGQPVPWSEAHSIRLNDAGTVAFGASLLMRGYVIPAIVQSHGATTLVVARNLTDELGGPNLGAGVVFASPSFDPSLSASGHVAFVADVAGPGVTEANNSGIWTSGDLGLRPVAREGEMLPGLGPLHARFRDFGRPVINAEGTIAFRAEGAPVGAASATREGIWSYSDGQFEAVAINGTDQQFGPGLGRDVKFVEFEDPTLNDRGMIAFKGYLRETGTHADLGSGLWTYVAGRLQPLVWTGQVLDFENGPGSDLRVVREAFFNSGVGSGEGLPRSLNNDGLLAFRLTFTDGSEGVFTALIVAVPEPGSLLIVGLTLSTLALRHARRRRPNAFA